MKSGSWDAVLGVAFNCLRHGVARGSGLTLLGAGLVLSLGILHAPQAQAQTGGEPTVICPLGELGCPPETNGTIAASPAVCNIDPVSGVCSATISWTASGTSQVEVWKRNLVTGSNTLFASSGAGANSLVANGITAQTLRFELFLLGVFETSVDVVGNPGPTVAVTAPANGAVFTTPFSVTLSASASDANGVAKVEFFDNGVLIGSPDTLAPYSVNWSSTALGSHSLSARATDALGAVGNSAPVSVSVGASTPVYAAQFVAQSVPASMIAGQSYAVSVQMKNIGSATWTAAEAYKLGSQNPGDNTTWGLGRVATPGSVGNGQTATFNFTAQAPATPGSYNFQWRMVRDGVTWFGDVTPNIGINVQANQAPTVAITTPTAGSSPAAPVGLTATAADSDGSIASVQYFEGANPISSVLTAPPYSYAWSTTAGSHTLTARAIDNLGAATQSAPVTFTVVTGSTITVALTQLAAGASFPAAQPIPLSATATTTSGSIVRVEFLDAGATVVATATSATSTFTASWPNASVGSHSLSARAITSSGASQTSSPAVSISVTNPPPTIALTAPTAGATFVPGSNITLSANASDANGTISKVEFFKDAGATLLGTAQQTTSPYTWVWLNVPAGNYTLSARATDNGLATTMSPMVAITVGAAAPQAVEVQYQYDALGRLVHVVYGNDSEVVYAYDAAGNRTIQSQTLR
ncbi:MAG: Ig-like domain-containing protein [Lysobacterales bacterium]